MTKMMLWEKCLGIFLMIVAFTASQDFDLFTFSEQWPTATCIKGKQEGKECIKPRFHNYWTIHGLWPDRSNETGPNYCPGPDFNLSEISGLVEELISYWPDIYNNSNTLWGHEWNRHGTCALKIPDTENELLYFKKGLELIQRFNITSILSKHDAPPNDVNPYTPKHIVNILRKELGHGPLLLCIEDTENKRKLLREVQICLDLHFEVIDCPKFAKNGTLFKSGCGKMFYYIPL
ncbi:hypothetical protein ACJMK2_037069 [Sinanodonta woodiana]|uniref:Uncharacterized protein n=1 Tax=Sinanodonta woodiana TaxID=1069815 RepID=A0ABD3WMM2_SINWO